MKSAIVRVNGITQDWIPALDRAVQYGDGLFETVRVRNAEPEFLARHLRRLRSGCERLRFPAIPWEKLLAEAAELAGQMPDGVLKIILTRGLGERGYRFGPDQEATRLLVLACMPHSHADLAQRGILVTRCNTRLCAQPLLAGIKHLNRLEQVLARAEWDDPGIHEGLLLDHDDYVIEGTMSNIFVVRGGTLLTPALTRCGVAGIMRSVIMDLARTLGIETEIRPLTLQQVQGSSEVFVCNSLIGIWPVRKIEGLADYPIGPLTQALAAALTSYHDSDQGNWYPS
jgi:4-amino-4-deoxychorismate lyase